MKRTLTVYCLILALIGAWIISSALTCYKLGRDGEWTRAYCWSNEFQVENGGEIEATATEIEIVYPTEQATATDELPLPWPTETDVPYPWPTHINPYP